MPKKRIIMQTYIPRKNKLLRAPKRKVAKYKTLQCTYIFPQSHEKAGQRCKAFASGNGVYCNIHGGTLPTDENYNPFLNSSAVAKAQKLLPTVGCNSLYNPEYHPLSYINYSLQGKSKEEICAIYGISSRTFNTWVNEYEAMNTAFGVGQTAFKALWICKGGANLENTRFNTALYKYMTSNLIGFSDKSEVQSNINHNVGVLRVPVIPASDDEWEILAQAKTKELED